MAALTNDAEVEVLRFLTGQGSVGSGPGGATVGTAPTGPAPHLPLKVALLTNSIVDDTTAPVEVTGGTYARQDVFFAAVTAPSGTSATQTGNSNVVRFENMPDVSAPGVQAFAIYDSRPAGSGGPRMWWKANLTNPRTYAAGDAAEFPVNELILEVK
jgi:hypothetical protein